MIARGAFLRTVAFAAALLGSAPAGASTTGPPPELLKELKQAEPVSSVAAHPTQYTVTLYNEEVAAIQATSAVEVLAVRIAKEAVIVDQRVVDKAALPRAPTLKKERGLSRDMLQGTIIAGLYKHERGGRCRLSSACVTT